MSDINTGGMFDWMSPQPAAAAGYGDAWGGVPYQAGMGGVGAAAVNGQGAMNPWQADWGQLGTLGKLGVVSQGLGAVSNLASLYSGFKQLSLQKKQFKFAQDSWNKNYNNQVKDYENTLKDRWTNRNAWAQYNGKPFESMESWVGSRSLTGDAPSTAPSSSQNNNTSLAEQQQQRRLSAPTAQNAGGG